MPKKVAPLLRIFAWSYSRWQDYNKCPLLAKLKHIDRLKEPPSAAGDRGGLIHNLAERHVVGAIKVLPKELEPFSEEFKELRSYKKVHCEQDWAFTKDWKPTGWTDRDAWLRIKMDVAVHDKENDLAIVIDYKTGRIYDDHEQQRSLYALGAFLTFPKIKKVIVKHWYIDLGEEKITEYLAEDLDKLKKEWTKRTLAMLTDSSFKPTPSPESCKYCAFKASKGGPCVY